MTADPARQGESEDARQRARQIVDNLGMHVHGCGCRLDGNDESACVMYRDLATLRIAAALTQPDDRGCPCLYTTPCDPRCTCVDRYSSAGCRRCCRYGSLEQRQAQAAALTQRPPMESSRLDDDPRELSTRSPNDSTGPA